MAKRLIDAEEIEKLFYAQVEYGATDLMDAFDDALMNAPTVDAVEFSVLENWLYEIAMNNTRNPLCDSCEEIIRRLSGLRKFAKKYGGQAPQREDV